MWLTVVMYLRFSQRANADGTVVRYVALAHNRRVDGKVKPDVLMNLGRVDRLDVDGLLRLAASIRKHFGDGSGLGDGAEAGLAAGAAPMEVIDARPIGTAWLLDALWAKLEIGTSIKRIADGRRFTTAVERVLFALVCNRAIEPMSKLSAAEWVTEDVAIPGLGGMDDDQAYRAMDLLVEADTQGRVQEAVFFAVANLLNLEVDLLFFDTTSTYFEADDQDQDEPSNGDGDGAGAGREGFRRYGKSKDHRDDLPQIVIGLAVTRTGIPVRCWCWPGNTQDQTLLAEVKDDLRAWKLGRVITCHNPDQAIRDQANREEAITRIEAELARIRAQRDRDRARKLSDAARHKADAAHLRAECALREHPTLGRWLRQQPNGRLVIDRAQVKAEARLDGKYLLATSDPDLSAEDVALGYKNLLEAERGFRDLKSQLLLRPVFHRLEHRIRAHVLLCWLALLLTRVAERTCEQSWRRIERETSRLAQVTLAGEAGTIVQTTPLRPTQRAIYQALSIDPPPRVATFDPA